MNKTQQEIEAIELEHRQMTENQKAYLPGYRQKIDRLLKCRDYTGLAEVLHSEKFLEACSSDTDMAYMIFCNQIYTEEQKTNPPHTIWENFYSVKDLLSHIQSLKFLLWRLEFGTDTGNELISCVKTHTISQTALKYMVQAFSMNKPELTERLTILFLPARRVCFCPHRRYDRICFCYVGICG